MPLGIDALCAALGLPPVDDLPWETITRPCTDTRFERYPTCNFYAEEAILFGHASLCATLTRRRRLEWRDAPGTYRWRVGNKILYEGDDVHGMALGGGAVPDLFNARVEADQPFTLTVDMVVLADDLYAAVNAAVADDGVLLPPQEEVFMHAHEGRCGDVACVWQ